MSLLIMTFLIILVLVADTFAQVALTSNAEMACQHLYEVMDKYHKSFDVYTDANAGGNHYIPSGWMGDWGDITFDGDHTANPHSGLTCIRIDYSAQESQGESWAGIYWQDPENNWGNLEGGYDLTGATKLTFSARGESGGEWIDFKVGGINRQSYHNSNFRYQDAFGPISTGFIQLTDTWQEYNIPLNKDYFDVYRDQHLSYYPSGWMGDWSDITFDDQRTGSPYNGRTCIRINYSAQGSQGMNWAGIYWQNPPNNWGNLEGGFDLTGFEKLIFRARGQHGGEKAEFKVGGITGPYGDSLQPPKSTGVITLTNAWQEYSIDLVGEDLSHIIGGFCWVTNTTQNPQGCTIYLDDIRYQRPINDEDLRQVIGGFVWVTNKDSNPNGCTFYLDDIQFNKARPDALRFLNSYEIIDPIGEAPLANTAFTYDNALAMLAFIAQGSEDDWRRAEIIGRSFIYAQNHDRSYADGRLRNAYRSGDIAENVTGNTLLPGWWDDVENMWFEDKEQVSSYTGNLAWVIIAWLRYYETKGDVDFRDAAVKLGEWIDTKTYDNLGPGGYTGGYQGWASDPPEKIKWKSTEHNIDVYVAFKKLHQLTGDDTWLDRALHAERFIQAMWNPDEGHLWTGTLDDGETINEDVRPADVNTWALMALGNYEEGIAWVESNCKVDPCISCGEWKGFDFNDDQDGVWFEGTAHTVVAFQILNETPKYSEFLNEIRRAQIEATNNNGKGIVAACHDGVTTGFDWVYNNRLHIGATGWYIFAENKYNPFWGTTTIGGVCDFDGDGKTDNSIYRRATGVWWVRPSSTGTPYAVGFGGHSSDIAVAEDYEGDGQADIAIYRAVSGVWWIRPSTRVTPYPVGFGGHSSDIPVPGDYDGDGEADIAIYRAASGVWWIRPSTTVTPYAVGWGGHSSDMPVPGDYDGDGEADIAIYRAASGVWWIRPSTTVTPYAVGFGGHSSDIPVPGDYDGDGEADIAIYRAASGVWWITPSSTGTPYATGFGGHPSDMPVPGDYDGDGEVDIAIYRAASGVWWIRPSSTGTPYPVGFGGHPSDMPVNPAVIHLY